MLAWILCASAAAQNALPEESPGKSVAITRGTSGPMIDGRLDDAVWAQAGVVDDLHQIIPNEYEPPSQPTRVYLFFDDEALYIGARMYDSEASDIGANFLRQGQALWGDDLFSVIIDSFNDKRNGYRFQVNPNSIRMEALFEDTIRTTWNWNGIWQAAATQDEDGWTAEMAIPFKTLSFNPQNDTWGINFVRDIARYDERIGWVSRNNTMNPSSSGVAVGFSGLESGRGLDIVPSVTLRQQKSFEPANRQSHTEPSLDVFYKLTPSLNGALTFNTDFSATEVDDRQVELTRFSLFFPEKRAFFLRESDIFRFGRIGVLGRFDDGNVFSRPDLENGQPFFSRRIGLSASGQPVDLEVGGKLSGRVGRWNLGALTIRQDEFQNVEASNLFVGRVAANVLAESTAGLIVTHGDPRSNRDNSVVGADFKYFNSRLPGGRTIQGDAWIQQSDTEGLNDKDRAYGFRIRAPNALGLRGGFGVKEIQENFFPALGFINRVGIRDYTAELGYTHRVRDGYIRDVYSGLDAERIDLMDGALQSQLITFRALEVDNHTRDSASLLFHATKEVLTDPFVIWERGSEEVVIPPGEYSFEEAEFRLVAGTLREFWGNLTYRSGDFFNGKRLLLATGFGWRPSKYFQTTLNYAFNDVELPQGTFQTRLVQLRTDVIFSPVLSWVTLIQYDNGTETMGVNTRLHWIPEAGREAFVVLNHNLGDTDRDNSFHSTLADLAIKFNYTIRF